MSFAESTGRTPYLETMRGRDYPTIRQFSIFSPSKVGQLLRLARLLQTERLRMCAVSIAEDPDCAIIRLVVSEPDRASEVLRDAGYSFCEVEILAVEFPAASNEPILEICSVLLQAEINIHSVYPLLARVAGLPALALGVDDLETACELLQKSFVVLGESDLQ